MQSISMVAYVGDWFRTTVGVRKGYLLSPTLFSVFLERIMTDALEDHQGTAALARLTTMLLRGGGQGISPSYFERGPWATFK